MTRWLVMALCLIAVEAGAATVAQPREPRDWSNVKIVPSTGITLGQTEWVTGDIATVSAAAGIPMAWYSPWRGNWTDGYLSGVPHIDLGKVRQSWREGRVVLVQAFNNVGGADSEHPTGYTIDKLLAGDYNAELTTFAAELRAFGYPVFIQVGREPNGAGNAYYGGFGPLGDQTLAWAVTNRAAYNSFTPPAPPSGASTLYDGLASATGCDGRERLTAAQRYIHDYLVRREGLGFLTFDTQGWAVKGAGTIANEANEFSAPDQAYALALLTDCDDFSKFYPGDAYADWVSINLHCIDYYQAGFPSFGLPSDILIPMSFWFSELDDTYAKIQSVTTHPIMFTELSFPDGTSTSSAYAATKVTDGLTTFLSTYPQIRGATFWSNFPPNWPLVDVFPFDTLIRNGSLQGTALRNVVTGNSGRVHGCAAFSNGYTRRNCVD